MSASKSVETKLIEKIRSTLLADETIKAEVNDRVYGSHISSVDNPVYPAISIMDLTPRMRENVPVIVDSDVQIDFWFPWDEYTPADLADIMGHVRNLLHRQNLSDTTVGLKVYRIADAAMSPLLYDNDASCYHRAARFAVTME